MPRSSLVRLHPLDLSIVLLVSVFCFWGRINVVTSTQDCGVELGGGICPNQNTCCAMANDIDPDKAPISGCIPNDMGRNATCCLDGRTGCPLNYECVEEEHWCRAINPTKDPLVSQLPRYRLCSAPQVAFVHGFAIEPNFPEKLIYYSSHGDIENVSPGDVRSAVIGIHGSGRNADDYFCSLLGASTLARNEKVLILTPRFPIAVDSDLTNITSGGIALIWPDTDPSGPWRYGADALNRANVSSFQVMDDLVRHVLKRITRNITIVGHSAGGQFVQRWALMSPVSDENLRYIVANPSSYAYLSPERWIDGRFRTPDQSVYKCFDYNQWEWGLDPPYSLPYISRVMERSTLEKLKDRFFEREVVYLIGSQDKCSGLPWCQSHGLETTCHDLLQGPNRWERHFRYVSHLMELGGAPINFTVPNVGHDHSLMFNSAVGRSVIFHVPALVDAASGSPL